MENPINSSRSTKIKISAETSVKEPRRFEHVGVRKGEKKLVCQTGRTQYVGLKIFKQEQKTGNILKSF